MHLAVRIRLRVKTPREAKINAMIKVMVEEAMEEAQLALEMHALSDLLGSLTSWTLLPSPFSLLFLSFSLSLSSLGTRQSFV